MTLEPANPSALTDTFETENVAPEFPVHIDLKCTTSTTKCLVHWGHCDQKKYIHHYVQLYIFRCTARSVFEAHKSDAIINKRVSFAALEYALNTDSGSYYSIYIEVKDPKDERVVAVGKRLIRACFSKEELQKLYAKAVFYFGESEMHEIDEIYRCKPRQYWRDIFNDDNIMRPYIKDENGHGENHINSTLKGLFFSALLNRNGTIRTASYFGNGKYSLFPYELLDPNVVNLYFGDFYCNANNPISHFVTIVVCKKQSAADNFCTKHLMSLEPFNPFFQVRTDVATSTYHINKNVNIKFFYTAEVQLMPTRLIHIVPLGRGSSRPNGLPNSKSCIKCNLLGRLKDPENNLNDKLCVKCNDNNVLGDKQAYYSNYYDPFDYQPDDEYFDDDEDHAYSDRDDEYDSDHDDEYDDSQYDDDWYNHEQDDDYSEPEDQDDPNQDCPEDWHSDEQCDDYSDHGGSLDDHPEDDDHYDIYPEIDDPCDDDPEDSNNDEQSDNYPDPADLDDDQLDDCSDDDNYQDDNFPENDEPTSDLEDADDEQGDNYQDTEDPYDDQDGNPFYDPPDDDYSHHDDPYDSDDQFGDSHFSNSDDWDTNEQDSDYPDNNDSYNN